jgi:hypothetical protein
VVHPTDLHHVDRLCFRERVFGFSARDGILHVSKSLKGETIDTFGAGAQIDDRGMAWVLHQRANRGTELWISYLLPMSTGVLAQQETKIPSPVPAIM